MEPTDKAHENRLRRAAQRQGMRLVKSRTRDPRALDYGWRLLARRRTVAGPTADLAVIELALNGGNH